VAVFAVYFAVAAPEAWIQYMYTVYALVAGVVYAMVAPAFLRLRKTQPEWKRPFRVKHGTFIGGLSFLFTLWVMGASLSEITLNSLVVLGGYFAVGLGLYIYAKYMPKAEPEEWTPIILGPQHVTRD